MLPEEKSSWRCPGEMPPPGSAGSWLQRLSPSPPLKDLAPQSTALTSGFNWFFFNLIDLSISELREKTSGFCRHR